MEHLYTRSRDIDICPSFHQYCSAYHSADFNFVYIIPLFYGVKQNCSELRNLIIIASLGLGWS